MMLTWHMNRQGGWKIYSTTCIVKTNQEHASRIYYCINEMGFIRWIQEETALRQVEKLAEHARVTTGEKTAEEWADFVQSQEWRLAMQSKDALATAQND